MRGKLRRSRQDTPKTPMRKNCAGSRQHSSSALGFPSRKSPSVRLRWANEAPLGGTALLAYCDLPGRGRYGVPALACMSEEDLRIVADPVLRGQLEGLRADFKEFSTEMRGMLRVVCDPISGYVPRSEVSEIRDSLHERINTTNARVDGMRVWVISLFFAFAAMITATVVATMALVRVVVKT